MRSSAMKDPCKERDCPPNTYKNKQNAFSVSLLIQYTLSTADSCFFNGTTKKAEVMVGRTDALPMHSGAPSETAEIHRSFSQD